MFMVIFVHEEIIYYQIDCAIYDLKGFERSLKYEVQHLCMKDSWNVLFPYRAVISLENYLSVNTVGRLDLISTEYFEYLLNEIYPYSKYLYDKIQAKCRA